MTGYGLEIGTVAKTLSAAGKVVPGRLGRGLREFDPRRPTTAVRAAATDALAGAPSDIVAAIDTGDPARVPLGMAIGAITGPLTRPRGGARLSGRPVDAPTRGPQAETQTTVLSARIDRARQLRLHEPSTSGSSLAERVERATRARIEKQSLGAAEPSASLYVDLDDAQPVFDRRPGRAMKTRLQEELPGLRRPEAEVAPMGEPVGTLPERIDRARQRRTREQPDDVVDIRDLEPDVDTRTILSEAPSMTGIRRDEGVIAKGRLRGPDDALDVPDRAQIVRDLSDALGVPFRSGRFKGGALGIFKINPEVVRSRTFGDIENVAHEVGHVLHKALFGTTPRGGLSNRVFQPWADELRPLGKGVSDESLAEGYAEFVRRYITNDDAAREGAPRFYQHFESTLEKELPEALNALRQARSDYRVWREAPAQARVRSQRARPEDFRPALAGADVWRKLRTAAIDNLHPLRVTARRAGMKPEDIDADIGTLADLARGSAGQAEWMVNQGMLDSETRTTIGPSLKQAFEPLQESGRIDPERYEDFIDYWTSRRVQYLYETRDDIKYMGIEKADADRVVADLGSDSFREVERRLKDFNDGLLDWLHGAGVLSSEARAAIRENNKVYAPLMRVMDDERSSFTGGKSKLGGDPIHRIKGSGRPYVDPAEVTLEHTYQYTRLAAKQRVSQALYELSKREGMGDLIEQVPAPLRAFKADLDEVLDKMVQTKGGRAAVAALPDDVKAEMLTFFRPGEYAEADNIVSVLVDGRRKFFEVEPELYKALTGIDEEQLDAWVRLASAPARTLRAGATLAPEFAIRNPIRDQVMAGVQSEWGYTPFVDLFRGVSSILKKDEYYEAFMAGGGARSSLLGLDRKTIRRNLQKTVGLEGVVRNPLDMLRALSEVMEDATRVGETRNVLDKLLAEGVPRGQAVQRAGAVAREISVDFARAGSKVATMRSLAAFWNARVQGYDRLARQFRKDPQGTTQKALAYITLPSIMEYAINRDDPEYFEIPQWQRDLFWVFKVKGNWIRIPKPFELGIVFGTLPVRALEVMDRNDPEGFGEAIGEFLRNEARGMAPIPTFAVPLIDNYANFNHFLERPIVSRRARRRRPRGAVHGVVNWRVEGARQDAQHEPGQDRQPHVQLHGRARPSRDAGHRPRPGQGLAFSR